MKIFYYQLTKKDELREKITPEVFAQLKSNTLRTCYADSKIKFESYLELINNKFNLPKEHKVWEFIDEPYEYYQDIRNNNQQSADLHNQK